MTTIGLERVGHFVRVPVQLPDGSRSRFLLDSGIGLTIVAPAVAERLRLSGTGGSFTGRRMSGQAVTALLANLPSLQLGDHRIEDAVVGIFDLGSSDGESGFDGVIGLDLLSEAVVTVDPSAAQVHISEEFDPAVSGTEIPVQVQRDGPSVCMFADLRLPSGRLVRVEIDTGSGCLILDSRFKKDCGVSRIDPSETISGTDETGHSYVREFAETRGPVQLAAAPLTEQQNPRTMFQEIIHDGLLGAQFLDRFVYSFDVRRSRLLLSL